MANNALLSVGQLCNEGYSATFKLDGVTLFNTKGNDILKGQCVMLIGRYPDTTLLPTKSDQLKAMRTQM
jgi:hypothetical protein